MKTTGVPSLGLLVSAMYITKALGKNGTSSDASRHEIQIEAGKNVMLEYLSQYKYIMLFYRNKITVRPLLKLSVLCFTMKSKGCMMEKMQKCIKLHTNPGNYILSSYYNVKTWIGYFVGG